MKRLLDTNIVLYFLGGRLADPLGPAEYFVSVVTEMELLSYPGLDDAGEQRIRDFLEHITVVGLLPEVRDAAVRLRRSCRIKLPDAIIAATALALSAELLTNDDQFKRIPDLLVSRVTLAGSS